ncbi:MAG: hypothetical protein ACR2PT_18265 [Endozoicomonas sp.]
MMELILLLLFALASLVVVYHHIGYPLVLRYLASKQSQRSLPFYTETSASLHWIICCPGSAW